MHSRSALLERAFDKGFLKIFSTVFLIYLYRESTVYRKMTITLVVMVLQLSCCSSVIPRNDCKDVLGTRALALSVSDKCSNLVLVINSTLLALKTLHSWPFITSLLSERHPHKPALFLIIHKSK